MIFSISTLYKYKYSQRNDSVSSDNVKISTLNDQYNNLEIFNEIWNTKIENFTNLGYFPQKYENSLQAIYYAVFSLNTISRIDTINTSALINSMMSYYDNSIGIFMDKYALRYLDTDIDRVLYPFTSVLQINCYAILTLDLLDNLNLINKQNFIDYIWSCFNYEYGGFIGQTYSENLESFFKIPTLDNTYFAVNALDKLNIDWTSYGYEIDLLTQFISSLQIDDPNNPSYGGFLNDPSYSIDTMLFFEPNMHASYYAIKSLQLLNQIGCIESSSFIQYLSSLYNEQKDYFLNAIYGGTVPINYTNICATAMGLELSEIINWDGCNKAEIFNFLEKGKNEWGIWDMSSSIKTHELIDTYQVLRSLYNTGFISSFTIEDLTHIGYAINKFKQYRGYSLISEDYTSIDLIYSVVKSFKIFHRISELEIASIYNQLNNAFLDRYSTFFSHSHSKELIKNFHSFPLKYFSHGTHKLLGETGMRFGHKSTFQALDAMQKLYKIDEFEIWNNLTLILNRVIESQFLDPNYDNYGGFMPYANPYDSPLQNKMVLLENSYYSIKILEVLSDYLNLGNITSLPFEKNALFTFLYSNLNETSTSIFYDPNYISDNTTKLENTYYMVYLLKVIDKFDLNIQKIENFVKSSLDYNNIKSVYYCFRLKHLLNLSISLDITQTQNLVKKIYDPELKECFLEPNKSELDQRSFLWISEMINEDSMKVIYQTNNPILLGHSLHLNVSVENIILDYYGPQIKIQFEDETIGTLPLTSNLNGGYTLECQIPLKKENHPLLKSRILVYEGDKLIKSKDIFLHTGYKLKVDHNITKYNKTISFYVNSSILTEGGSSRLYDSSVFVDIYRNMTYIDRQNFLAEENNKYSEFRQIYNITEPGNYNFKVYLDDGLSENVSSICNTTHSYALEDDGDDGNEGINPEEDPIEEENNDDNEGDGSEEENNEETQNEQNDDSNEEDTKENINPILIFLITVPTFIALITGLYKKKFYQ